MQGGYNISCRITIETAFIQKNRVENTILAKLLQNTELALSHNLNVFLFYVPFVWQNHQNSTNLSGKQDVL
jgi:hypothetical protein